MPRTVLIAIDCRLDDDSDTGELETVQEVTAMIAKEVRIDIAGLEIVGLHIDVRDIKLRSME